MTNAFHPNFFAGLSGLALPLPKYQFPEQFQQTSRLTYYSSFFNSIEINSTFYKIPRSATVGRWAESVPENFKFTFKLFREITHAKNLDFDLQLIDQFMQTITSTGTKKGCILIQFPASLSSDHILSFENILKSLKFKDTENSWSLAVEFRNSEWYNDELYEMLNNYGVALVRHDMTKSATPAITTSANFVYVRFHGPTGNYRGSYTDAFLSEYTEYILDWLIEGKMVYVYFNNTAGDAFENLRRLNELLSFRPLK
jgi:uncharacterized protein YecE (DUF72 family)